MSQAVRGDGRTIANTKALLTLHPGCVANADAMIAGIRGLMAADEAGYRRNMDVETSKEVLSFLDEIARLHEAAEEIRPVAEAALKHHSAQPSALPNSYFNQTRRLLGSGNVSVQDLGEVWDHFCKRLLEDRAYEWEPTEMANYVFNGQNPPKGFEDLDRESKLRILKSTLNMSRVEVQEDARPSQQAPS